MLRRRLMMQSKGLPIGYERLKYIESTGTQWINLGISSQDIWAARFRYEFPSIQDYTTLCGVLGGDDNTKYTVRLVPWIDYSYKAPMYYIRVTSNIDINKVLMKPAKRQINTIYEEFVSVSEQNILTADINGVLYGGANVGAQPSAYNQIDLYLFAYNYDNDIPNRISKLRLDFLEFYNSNYEIKNRFVSVFDNNTKKAGVYDEKTGIFQTNRGSGKWICHRMDGTTFIAN